MNTNKFFANNLNQQQQQIEISAISTVNHWTKAHVLTALQLAAEVNRLFNWIDRTHGERNRKAWCDFYYKEGQLILAYSSLTKYHMVHNNIRIIMHRMHKLNIKPEQMTLTKCLELIKQPDVYQVNIEWERIYAQNFKIIKDNGNNAPPNNNVSNNNAPNNNNVPNNSLIITNNDPNNAPNNSLIITNNDPNSNQNNDDIKMNDNTNHDNKDGGDNKDHEIINVMKNLSLNVNDYNKMMEILNFKIKDIETTHKSYKDLIKFVKTLKSQLIKILKPYKQ